jgi:hypothetical protein
MRKILAALDSFIRVEDARQATTQAVNRNVGYRTHRSPPKVKVRRQVAPQLSPQGFI